MRALLFAGLITAGGLVASSRDDREPTRSFVVHAAAPFAIGDGRSIGNASFGGAGWKMIVGWRSEKARTEVAVALAHGLATM